MAEANKTPSEQPTPTGSLLNAEIFTMPEGYRHGKEAKLVEPVKEEKKVPLPPPKPPTPPQKIPQKKQTHKALILSGVLVLVALGIAGYLLLRSAQPKPQPTPTQPEPVVPVVQPTVPEPVVEPEPVVPALPEVFPGKDSDSDGLTDLEENLLYKTNPNLPDTDVDGFLDGNEVFHRYNPSGTAPGTLLDAGAVRLFERNGIRLAFPVPWQTSSASETSDVFESTTGEFMTLTVTNSTDTQTSQASVSAWITQQGGQEQTVKTVSKGGYELYVTQDKRHALMVVNGKILEFVYDLGTKTTVDYLQTFQMMLNSIELMPAV